MKPVVIKPEKVISGTKYIENFKFKSRHEVPIYEVTDCSGLNQIIGYIKLINKSYGKVFYRGQCDLYDTCLLYTSQCGYAPEREQEQPSFGGGHEVCGVFYTGRQYSDICGPAVVVQPAGGGESVFREGDTAVSEGLSGGTDRDRDRRNVESAHLECDGGGVKAAVVGGRPGGCYGMDGRCV